MKCAWINNYLVIETDGFTRPCCLEIGGQAQISPIASGIVKSFNNNKLKRLELDLEKGDLFVTIEESDLVSLIKQIKEDEFILGDEIGIISYNDTPLKDLLGINPYKDSYLDRLTPSEKKILKLIAKDKTNKDIASLLFISHRTVEKHRSNIIQKLKLEHKTNSLLIWAKDNIYKLL